MSTVKVPASVNEAKRRLTSLDSLITATGWERAAIVAALVPGHYSATEFAALRITGLRSTGAVTRCVEAWCHPLEVDGVVVKPVQFAPALGSKVKLPSCPYPTEAAGTARSSGGRPRAPQSEIVDRAGEDDAYAAELIEKLLKANPAAAKKAIARNTAGGVPEAPFDTPPEFQLVQARSMGADHLINNIRHIAALIERHQLDFPEVWTPERGERLAEFADRLAGMASIAMGVPSDASALEVK